jgi:hypothetical protein
MEWTGNIARMGDVGNACTVVYGALKGKRSLVKAGLIWNI